MAALWTWQDDGAAVKVSSAVSAVVAVVAAMAGFVILSVKGVDPTSYVTFVTVFLIPQVVQMVRQDKTQRDVEVIKHRTNGPLDAQAETLTRIEGEIREMREEGRNDAGRP